MPSGCHELVEDDLTLVTAALDVATSDVDEQLALGQNTHGPPHLVPSACAIVRTRRVSSFVRQFPHPSVFFVRQRAYTCTEPAPTSSAQLHQGGELEIARLKSNVGGQNYDLPADVDLSRFRSVGIYCKQFSVVFSSAELSPAAS